MSLRELKDEWNHSTSGWRISMVSSWFLAFTITVFIGSGCFVCANWFLKREVPEVTRKVFFVSLGGTVGLFLISLGGDMLGNRQSDERIEKLYGKRPQTLD